MSEKVLVTGATGFIGRAVVRCLGTAGAEVIGLGSANGDIRDPQTLRRFGGDGIKAVVHLAGRSFVPASWSDPTGFIDINVSGTANALEFCRAQGAAMVFVSAYVYGVPDRLPIDEFAPVRPNNPYALSKHLAEELCRFYAGHFSIATTVLRPFNVYGPGQDPRFLIPSIVQQALRGAEIEVMDLAPRRDWVYVSDFAEAVNVAVTKVAGYNAYNVGSGHSHSVSEVIDIVQREAGRSLTVRAKEVRRHNEIPDVVADISKISKELGWSPKMSFESGVRECIRETRN